MTAGDHLSEYLDLMRRRLRLYALTRGAAIAIAAALLLTIILAWIVTAVAASPVGFVLFRILLFVSTGLTVVCAMLIPSLRLGAKNVAHEVERRFAVFEQRLVTFLDRSTSHPEDPFLPLLASNTLEISQHTSPENLVTRKTMAIFAAAAGTAALVLTCLILLSPGSIGRGAKELWTGRGAFAIEVKASQKIVRRGADLTVSAHLTGFTSASANLWVRDSDAAVWKRVPMLAGGADSDFALRFAPVHDSVEYYAEAEGIRSPISQVKVIDLPHVKSIAVTYPHDPALQKTDGDVIAPAGAIANLEFETDRPMDAGKLILETGDSIALTSADGNKTSVSLRVLRDDGYHVSVMYAGESVPVSDEYAIEVMSRNTNPPRPPSLLSGVHSGPVPVGYENAVADYYQRLAQLQNSR